jgi:hypothetical protein
MGMEAATMTDRPRTSARPPSHPHPLLGAFPLVVMTLATFLVVFTLMMARLSAGADPAVHVGTSISLGVARSGAGAVRTRASGGGESPAAATPAAGSGESSAPIPVVVTRTSGAAGTRELGDE